MVIRFACPNGHPLTSPEQSAGRKSKCPECGASVIVPKQSARPGPQDVIVFLCPNGHRLNGPKSLEGKPGQCPHCGAKFRVPSSDEMPEEEPEEVPDGEPSADEPIKSATASASADNGSGETLYLEDVEEVADEGQAEAEEKPGAFNFNFEERAETGEEAQDGEDEAPEEAPGGTKSRGALPALFDRLWRERARGAIVEIHLTDGATIVPERFARDLSRHSHAVFAVKDPDGSHTLSVVPWSAVQRVTVRRVTQLPKELFG
jgi:hypothetical protein